mgnify:CR=1 FL=1
MIGRFDGIFWNFCCFFGTMKRTRVLLLFLQLINIFIGANDFCFNLCYMSLDAFKNSAETHRRQLMMTLDYLRDNLPRTLVSILLVPSMLNIK